MTPALRDRFEAACLAEALAWRKRHGLKLGQLINSPHWVARHSEENHRNLNAHMEQFARAWLKARGHHMTRINRERGECEVA